MENNINRRSALRLGLFGLAAGGVASSLGPRAFGAPVFTGPGNQMGAKKLLLIFLRGGNDGINTLIPDGDPDYLAARPAPGPGVPGDPIGIPTADSLPLNNFARLHPALTEIHSLFGDGDLALMHRIGHPFPNFSHFTSQQYWETAHPGQLTYAFPGVQILLENGFVTRAFASASSLSGFALPGASLSGNLMRLFASDNPNDVLAHIPSVDGFSLNDGALPDGPNSPLGKLRNALRGAPGQPGGAFGNPQGGSNALLLGATGKLAFDAEEQVAAAQNYTPSGTVTYPVKNAPTPTGIPLPNSGAVDAFGNRLKDAVALLKNTSARIVGVELGGFDTHSKQGGIIGQHADQLRVLAAGMRAVYDDMQNSDPDLVTLTMSEFGRTSAMNGSDGTDHGTSSVMMAMGPSVQGGVYNCSTAAGPGMWEVGTGLLDGDMFGQSDKYLPYLTDYRAVLAEVLDKHLGVSRTTVGLAKSEMDSVVFQYDLVKQLSVFDPTPTAMDDLNFL